MRFIIKISSTPYLQSCILLFFILNTNIFSEVWLPIGRLYKKNQKSFSYKLGYSKSEGGDSYLYIEPRLTINQRNWGFSVSYPFYYLAYDVAPEDKNGDGLGAQKKIKQSQEKKYDIAQDYAKVVDYFWFGNYNYFIPNRFTYLVFLGKITDGNLGHGSIFGRYINNSLNESQNYIGANVSLHYKFVGIEMISNSIDKSEVYGGRISLNPLFFVNRFLNSINDYSDISLSFFLASVQDSLESRNVSDDVGRAKVEEDVLSNLPYSSAAMVNSDDLDERERANKQFQQWLRKNNFIEEEGKNSIFDSNRLWWNKLFIGYTYAQDVKAPLTLEYDGTGKVIVDEKTRQPKIEKSDSLKIEGYDIEYYAFSSEKLVLLPYCDQNRIYNVKKSKGTHCGLELRLGSDYINLTLKSEYRKFAANYIPTYFDSFYESERFQYRVVDIDNTSTYLLLADYYQTGKKPSLSDLTSDSELQKMFTLFQDTDKIKQNFINQYQKKTTEEIKYNVYFTPKLQYLNDIDIETEDDKVGTGNTLVFNFYDISIHAFYENYDGKYNSSIFLGMYVPLGPFFISGYYTKRGFEETSEAFKVNNNSILSAEVGLNIFGLGSLKYIAKRYWEYNENNSSFESKEDKSVYFSQTIRF